ncbi:MULTISPECIES: hypothetical protein [Kitasatospora]|uniref:Uncharacterized protein n=1 Tax=Kitasatospora cystarginea TaxID=58350 RepID=A0ABP5RU96_9ACTN
MDWRDIPAFAETIRQVLTQEQIGELAETLINKPGWSGSNRIAQKR